MIGALLTVLIGSGVALMTQSAFRTFWAPLDPAAQLGISGLAGLGAIGTVAYFLFVFGVSPMVVLVVTGVVLGLLIIRDGNAFLEVKGRHRFSLPKGADLLFPLAIGMGLVMSLAGVLAPSTPNDWDSLAYHLAVPKLWLEAGRVTEIPFIHQSNFPFAVDSLFLFGLSWGGQAAAKAFVWTITLFGITAIFGLGRQRYGVRAGWWSAWLFSSVPIVLWQSGTAYIDVAHGLYAGLGLVFACWWLESNDSKHAWLSAILLGFAAGTKYTGLQTIAIAGLIALIGAILLKRGLKPVFVIGLASLALASPWYVKNAVWKDNPVFPFFFSSLGGKDWDQRRAEIYTREQNTFGAGREFPPESSLEVQRIGHSILGLAYQPGRYVNPLQTRGQGDPMGAVGIAAVIALLAGMSVGKRSRFENALLSTVLLSLAFWFVLTQQSRYIVTLCVPLALLAGQLTTRKGFGSLVSGATVVQAVMSLYLVHTLRFSDQMEVVSGRVTPEEYLSRRIGFFEAARDINTLGKSSKVALYDEVFGYLLDVPYYWANPGHGTMIPYDEMDDGAEYASLMMKGGFTHVYLNLSPSVKDPKGAAEIVAAINGAPFPQESAEALRANWETKFNWLVVDAVQKGELEVVKAFGNPERPRGFLLQFRYPKQSAKS